MSTQPVRWRCQTSGRLHYGNPSEQQECTCPDRITDTALLTPRIKRPSTAGPLPMENRTPTATPVPEPRDEAADFQIDDTAVHQVEDIRRDTPNPQPSNAITPIVASPAIPAAILPYPAYRDNDAHMQALRHRNAAPRSPEAEFLIRTDPVVGLRPLPIDPISADVHRQPPVVNARMERTGLVMDQPMDPRVHFRISRLYADQVIHLQQIQAWKDAYQDAEHERRVQASHARYRLVLCTFLIIAAVLYVFYCYLNGPEMAYIRHKRAELFYEL